MVDVPGKKKRAYHNLDGLYSDVEAARRAYELGEEPGASAYKRWLEIFDITEWMLEDIEGDGASEGDSPELARSESDGSRRASPSGGEPAQSDRQLELPSPTGLGADVPRGTQRQPRNAQAVGRAQLSDADFRAEAERRGIDVGSIKKKVHPCRGVE